MPTNDTIIFTQREADKRLVQAFDALVAYYDLPLPSYPEPIPGTNPAWARAERTMAAAIRAEAILEHLRRPLTA